MTAEPLSGMTEDRRWEQRRAYGRGLTRKANRLGLALLLTQLFGSLLMLLLPWLFGLLLPGVSLQNNLFYESSVYVIYSPVAIGIPFWLANRLNHRRLTDTIPFAAHSPTVGIGCIMLCFLGIALGNCLGDVVVWLLPTAGENLQTALGPSPETPAELVVALLQTAAIPALVEEFAFRGVVLSTLRPYGDRFAIIASALLFGLFHGNFVQMPFAFCVGLFWGYAVVRTGSLLPAILAHGLNNAMSVLMDYRFEAVSTALGNYYSSVFYGFWSLLGVAGFLILRFGIGRPLRECYRPYNGLISAGRRNARLAFAPVMLIAVVILLGNAVFMLLPGGGGLLG